MKKRSAFSLFEISIVLLVISILLVGIMKGREVVSGFNVLNAAKLTRSSVVGKIDGLTLWLETTSQDSFDHIEASDGHTVSVWRDISASSLTPKNATQTIFGNRPEYITNVINGLPVLRFDGVDDFLNYDGTFLANTHYTIFVVEQRRATGVQMFLGGSAIANNANLHFGYVNDTTATLDHFSGNSYQYTSATIIPAYTSPIPRIHSYRAGLPDPTGSKNYYINGANTFTVNCAAAPCDGTTPLSSYAGASIGRYVGTFYNGDVAEVIMFTRYLSDQEREDVEQYLSRKWGIDI